MKKLISFSAIAAMFAVAAISCSNEPDEVGKGPDTAPEGKGYFSFSMTAAGVAPSTRAEDAGLLKEQKVNDVTVLLYDATGADAVLRYKFDLEAMNHDGSALENFKGDDVASGEGILAATNARFVSVGREVDYQDYQMVVLVNTVGLGPHIEMRSEPAEDPGRIIDYLEVGVNTLSDINKVWDSSSANFFKKSDWFFMSNANGIVDVPRTALKETKTEAEKAPVKVKVDRAIAKVRIYEDFPATYITVPADEQNAGHILAPNGIKIGEISAVLNITSMQSYLIRQLAGLAPQEAGGPGGQETKSYDTDRAYQYAKDVTFTGMKDKSVTDLEEYFFDASYDPAYTLKNWADREDEDAVYVTENTMDLEDQKSDKYLNYTTHYLIYAQIAPKGMELGQSYYSYVNQAGSSKVFTHEQALTWLDEDDFPIDMPDLKAKLVAINGDSESVFDFTPNSSEPMLSGVTTENGISFHFSGENIYTVPIKHFQPTQSTYDAKNLLYGHYGVVRNNYYTVKITGITGPGTGASGWISADITINPWYLRDQNEEL